MKKIDSKKIQIENSIKDINIIYNRDINNICKKIAIIDALLINLSDLLNGVSRATFLHRTLEILTIICRDNVEYIKKLNIVIFDKIHYNDNERKEAHDKYIYHSNYNDFIISFSLSFYGKSMHKKLIKNIFE